MEMSQTRAPHQDLSSQNSPLPLVGFCR